MALLLTLNRKIHKAYNRTREGNFSLEGLLGFNLHGKTVGLVGCGKIGGCFIKICSGFGMNVLCYDVKEDKELAAKYNVKFVDFETLIHSSDIISLHCPLNAQTKHIVNQDTISRMKEGVYIINTGLKRKHIGGLGLDVYE